MARTSVTTPKDPASYEQAVAELDQLVQRMEAGQLPLDQLLDSYRRGSDLLVWCRQRQQRAQPLAAVEHAVAHGHTQPGRRIGGHPALQGRLHRGLALAHPGVEFGAPHAGGQALS